MNESRLKVLIVEDETLLALYLRECIEESGHEVVGVATNASEAIAIAGQTAPNLAFVDIHLRDGNTGVSIARSLSQGDDTLVVFMTANSKLIPDDFAGAAGVVVKPYSQNGLMAAIRFIQSCLQNRRAEGRVPASLVLSSPYRERWHVAD